MRLLTAIVASLMLLGCGPGETLLETEHLTTPSPAILRVLLVVNAEDLYQAYDYNERAADARYKDEWVKVTARVQQVRWRETPGLLKALWLDVADPKGSLMCAYRDVDSGKASTLSLGDWVTVVGQVDGYGFLTVHLENCEIGPSAPTRQDLD